MLKKLGTRIALLVALMVGAAGLVVIAAFYLFTYRDLGEESRFRVSPETTYYVEPIRSDGSVDFAAAINAELGSDIAPEENAYALLLQAIGPVENASPTLYDLLGIKPPNETSVRFRKMDEVFAQEASSDERLETLLDVESELRARPWQREEYPEVVQLIEQNRETLERVHQAVASDKYFRPLVATDENGQPLLILDDHLCGIEELRGLARLLMIHAMLKLHEGDTQAAWDDLIACRRLGRLVAHGPTLIDVLVGYSIEGTTNAGIAALLSHSSPDAETIARYQADLAAMPPITAINTVINRTERCSYIQVIQAIAKGRPEAVSYFDTWDPETLAKASGPGFNWNEPLIHGNALYNESVLAMELPTYSERTQALDELETQYEEMMSNTKLGVVRSLYKGQAAIIGESLLLIMLPATSTARMVEDRVRQQAKNIDAALALAAFKEEHGDYPENLGELVPDFLDEVPQDIFADNALVYRPSENGYTLYSIGPDVVDQGGSDDDGADDLSIVIQHE